MPYQISDVCTYSLHPKISQPRTSTMNMDLLYYDMSYSRMGLVYFKIEEVGLVLFNVCLVMAQGASTEANLPRGEGGQC